jgi:dephospho-CoA kinase
MHVIGIVGGVASGKSAATDCLRELGAETIDADRLGHEALRSADVQEAARRRWGEQVFTSDGQIDRSALAKIVFGQSAEAQAERAFLERLTHPKIKEAIDRVIDEARRRGAKALVVDAAVMIEAGWSDRCDPIVFVDAPRETRLARAKQRGWSESEFERREAAQVSLDEKRGHADVTIDNSGSIESTRRQLEQFWRDRVA